MSRPAVSPGFVYAAIIAGTLVISLDFASVDLALPAMEQQFGLNLDGVQWVINGYVLAFSVLMVTGGKLADAYGRKSSFLVGMGIFLLASLLGGAASSGTGIIVCRVLQGIGAALLWPAMIGMACAAVGEDKRGLALGLIFGTSSVGNAAGPLVGGALTEWLSWRWVLWINVPLALLAMLMTFWKIPKDVPGERARNDYAGMIVLTTGLVALMLSVYQGQAWGWSDPRTLGLCIAAVVFLGAFPILEGRTPAALIPPDLLRNREIVTLCVCVFVICQLFFIVLLFFPQYAMKFLGDDPIAAGARVVQFMLAFGLSSYFGGPLLKIFGARNLLLIGLGASILASIALGIVGPGAPSLPYNLLLILFGFGVGAVIPTVSSRAIETAGTERASLVSGVTFMCQLAGSAVMLAVNTAIFTMVGGMAYRHFAAASHLPAVDSGLLAQILTGSREIQSSQLPPQAVSAFAGAYENGLQAVMWVGAALLVVAFLLVLRFVPARQTKLS